MTITTDRATSEPSLAHQITALYSARIASTRQANRLILLGAIAACVAWIRVGYPLLTTTRTAANAVGDRAAAVVESIAPEMGESPKAGERIGPYTVSSPYGPRTAPCSGCSSNHKGTDIAAPVGSQQFIPDSPTSSVAVECFTYSFRGNTEKGAKFTTSYGITVRSIHLSKCQPGNLKGGTVFALGGDSGTGPHWHIETYRDGAIFAPPREVLWWIATGSKPAPTLTQGGTDATD